MTSTTLVLGAGVGGIVAAHELRKRLPRDHRILLVDRVNEQSFAPSYLWVLTGERQPAAITRKLDKLVRKRIEFIHAGVTRIDLAHSRVETTNGPIEYDHLVIALGAQLAPNATPGLAEAGETFYTRDGAVQSRLALDRFAGGKLALLVAGTPFKCPAAPYEAMLLVESALRHRGLREKAELHMYTPEKLPMPVAGPLVGQTLKTMLEARGIHYHSEHKATSVDPKTRRIAFHEKADADYDLLLHVPMHQAPQVLREAGLLNEAGWIPVDPATLETKHENTYAIGDNTAIKLASGLALPKAGVFAHAEAKVIAKNIASKLQGREPNARFDGHGFCWVETGDARAAFGRGNFYATPNPDIHLQPPTRRMHIAKVLFEKYWLWKWY